jgi:2-polyprenyl-6-hydroxyphenyl methylase/3-demethylubiquinone-9 3-methyltransferase
MASKNTICLWYERDAEEAAHFYAKTFPDSAVKAVRRAPGDYPSGKQGDVLVIAPDGEFFDYLKQSGR